MESLTNWRLLITASDDAYRNMAIDEAILQVYRQGSSPPTLRIYGWQPPALSLGYFQDAAQELDLGECRKKSIDIVRRITGGSIVFHADELTYSIVCSAKQFGCAGSIEDSFKRICSFIVKAYQKLGLEAGFAIDRDRAAKALGRKTAFCFSGREKYDILIKGKKIGGNAQRRFHNIIFQHGSIPLKLNLDFVSSLLREKSLDLEQGITSLAGALARPIEFDQVARELIRSFRELNSSQLSEGVLSGEENALAEHLRREKYSRSDWNIFRRRLVTIDENRFKKAVLA